VDDRENRALDAGTPDTLRIVEVEGVGAGVCLLRVGGDLEVVLDLFLTGNGETGVQDLA
jgi:hypothetical protein